MLGKSFSLLFYLKKQKNYKGGSVPIYMRITVNCVSKEISLTRKCDLLKWNVHSQRALGSKEEIRYINEYLDTMQTKVYEARRQLIEDNQLVTSELLKNILIGKKEKPRMLLEIFQFHNDQMSALVGTEFADGTLERYKTSFEHTKSFLEWKYNITDIDIRKLDFEFVTEYEFWLKSVRKCNHNTSIKYIANFRKIINRCIRNGWLLRDPFIGFKMTKREVEPVYLTKHEIQLISKKRFASARLNETRPDRTANDPSKPLNDVTGENFTYYNQCAIRMSITLKKSGVSLSGAKNITNPGKSPYGNGYIIGATNLATFLKDNLLGKPVPYDGTKVDVRTLLAGKTGILYLENFIESGVRSHSIRI